MGSPIAIHGTRKTFALSPWRMTPHAHRFDYFREPVPWDKRRVGIEALSDPQAKAAAAFIDVAKHGAEPDACQKKTGMPRNICRVESIGDKLRGKDHGGTSYENRLAAKRKSDEELGKMKTAITG